ncbi:hypothetical protein EHS25_003205 [Saitozyma podzolica]|uniref:Methionine aminopeptidase n=1 Tax=Saitozyma podzolica TaxID=1890683 RepID=A0A427Y875_9TREE|nr:hypothetical protein EHS25_003205 [Saitozyma podzolica]
MEAYPDPLAVPDRIPRPDYVPESFWSDPWSEVVALEDLEGEGPLIQLGGEEEKAVRRVGKMAAEVMSGIGRFIQPGITTEELDAKVHEFIIERGAYPSPLGYSSFPKSCTTSVNNVIAHGIPDGRLLHPEDVINIDLTLFLNGYHGDTSKTFMLPAVDKLGRDLVEATREALELGIRACGPGKKFSGIGNAIEDFAKRHGFSVNSQFSGHGIGRNFHQKPWILHNRKLLCLPGLVEPEVMLPGHCFTIEPCLVQGLNARGSLWDDGWTMSTETGARSAQFEHQVLITESGVDVLTRRAEESV